MPSEIQAREQLNRPVSHVEAKTLKAHRHYANRAIHDAEQGVVGGDAHLGLVFSELAHAKRGQSNLHALRLRSSSAVKPVTDLFSSE